MHPAGRWAEHGRSHSQQAPASRKRLLANAILLGAAETATSELKERLDNVVVELESSKILIINDGPKAIFVLRTSRAANVDSVRAEIARFSKRVEEHL